MPGCTRGARHALVALVVSGAAVMLLAACGPQEPRWGAWEEREAGNSWSRSETVCVRSTEEGPERRVVNYVDPELCGRSEKQRSPDRVRALPERAARR